MRRSKVLATVCILALSITVALAAQARPFGGGQKGHGPGGFHGMRLLMALGLSSDQKQAVADIIKKYEQDQDKARESMQERRLPIAALMTADEFNEAAIRQTFQESSAIMEEVVVLRARMYAEIKSVLDADQLEQLAGMEQKREERMAQRKKHRDFKHARHQTWLQTDSE